MRGRARIAAACVAVGLAAGSVGAVELHGSKAKPAKPRLTRQQLGAKKLLAEYAQHPPAARREEAARRVRAAPRLRLHGRDAREGPRPEREGEAGAGSRIRGQRGDAVTFI
jgi:hypothetical protein